MQSGIDIADTSSETESAAMGGETEITPLQTQIEHS